MFPVGSEKMNIIQVLYEKSQTPDLKFSEYSAIYDAVKKRILSGSNRQSISCKEYAAHFRTPPGTMTAIFEALLNDKDLTKFKINRL